MILVFTGLQCPIPDNKQCFVYYNQCYSDDECVAARGAGYKCCPEPGCGNECKVPGNCPEPEPIFCIQEYDECYSDDECFVGYGSGYKCCPQPGCGLTCKKAV